jgi:hypothetical protein
VENNIFCNVCGEPGGVGWHSWTCSDCRGDDAIREKERERCAVAIQNHDGFTDDEKRIAIAVIAR